LSASAGFSDTKKGEIIDGKKEFEEHCNMCHPNGGYTINAIKTLSEKSLKTKWIKTSDKHCQDA
jgi:cytochrome c6